MTSAPNRLTIPAINFIILLAIIVYSIANYKSAYLTPYVVAGSTILILALLASFFTKRWRNFLRTIVYVFNITYVLLELTTYLLLSFGVIRPDLQFFFKGIMATDKGYAQYDSISGYRGIPGKLRYMDAENGEFEIDHICTINKQGWYSERDYSFHKRQVNIKRYMVLGDSYSSGISVPVAWPDIVQGLLAKEGNDSIELYNFSLDGSGIVNWYRIFNYELIPKYDFDGVVIASASEKSAFPDLDRKFIIMHSFKEGTYINVMDVLNSQVPAVFPKSTSACYIPIYPPNELNRIKEIYLRSNNRAFSFKYKKPDLWFLSILYGVTDGLKKIMSLYEQSKVYNEPYENYYKLANEPYKMEYFDSRYKYGFMLKEIIEECKRRGKQVVLVNIPDYENSFDYVNHKKTMCQNECRFLSEYYHTSYFDGFSIFDGRDSTYVDSVFYRFDRHLNSAGVTAVAQKMVKSGVLQSK